MGGRGGTLLEESSISRQERTEPKARSRGSALWGSAVGRPEEFPRFESTAFSCSLPCACAGAVGRRAAGRHPATHSHCLPSLSSPESSCMRTPNAHAHEGEDFSASSPDPEPHGARAESGTSRASRTRSAASAGGWRVPVRPRSTRRRYTRRPKRLPRSARRGPRGRRSTATDGHGARRGRDASGSAGRPVVGLSDGDPANRRGSARRLAESLLAVGLGLGIRRPGCRSAMGVDSGYALLRASCVDGRGSVRLRPGARLR